MCDQFKRRMIHDVLVYEINLFNDFFILNFLSILARLTGTSQQMSRNSDLYVSRNRNQPSNIKRPLPTNNNIDHHQQFSNNNRSRRGPMNNSSVNNRRRSNSRRSRSHINKMMMVKQSSRVPPPPKYACILPKASLDW